MKLLCVLLLSATAYAGSFSCPYHQTDMLDYFVMSYPAREGNHMGPGAPGSNAIYSVLSPDLDADYAEDGIFFWVKNSTGWPWDVKSYDANYIYDRATELSWTSPKDFKRFNKDVPLSPRCIPWGQSADVKVQPSGTDFTFYHDCNSYEKQNLGYVHNVISKPVYIDAGNLGSIRVRYFNYNYSCDSSFRCHFLEIFTLAEYMGLIDWKYYKDGQLIQHTSMDQFQQDAVIPYTPCSNLYE